MPGLRPGPELLRERRRLPCRVRPRRSRRGRLRGSRARRRKRLRCRKQPARCRARRRRRCRARRPRFRSGPGPPNQAPGLVSAGSIKAGPTGFSFESADGANVIRFRGNLAVDGRWFMDHNTPESDDTFLFRKVRPYIEGTIDNDYDFRFMPDFAGGKTIIVDAFVTARILPWLAVQAGKFKGPVGPRAPAAGSIQPLHGARPALRPGARTGISVSSSAATSWAVRSVTRSASSTGSRTATARTPTRIRMPTATTARRTPRVACSPNRSSTRESRR